MKIYLAGGESPDNAFACGISGNKNLLFSYYSFSKTKSVNQLRKVLENIERFDLEVIVDSGLFSFMFGAGKEIKHDERSLREYAHGYLKFIERLPIKKLTIVECDAQKIIGTKATNKIRKELFERSGYNVMYVWHIEDSIDALMEMASKYKYFSLGCPELRKAFKREKITYNRAIEDLMKKIRMSSKILPKVHLLGNTIFEHIQFHDVYSCDSTTWLNTSKFGTARMQTNEGYKHIKIKCKEFLKFKNEYFEANPDILKDILSQNKSEIGTENLKNQIIDAYNLKLFQEKLDRRFKWQGDEKKLKGLL